MTGSDYVIGIDGGGTRSRGVALRVDGKVLASTRGGALNFYATSQALFARNLNELVEALQSEVGESRCLRTVVGTAALFYQATPEERAMALEAVKSDSMGDITLVGDAVTAVSGAGGGRETILVIAGTGSIAVRLVAPGEVAFSGGLGPMLGGDPGSAFWMASRALELGQRHFCREGTHGALGRLLCEFFETTDIAGIVSYVHRADDGRARLASAAKVLSNCQNSDVIRAWREIEARAGRALADLIHPLVRERTNGGSIIYIAGSVLTQNERVRQALGAALSKVYDRDFSLECPEYDAAMGAGFMALQMETSSAEKWL